MIRYNVLDSEAKGCAFELRRLHQSSFPAPLNAALVPHAVNSSIQESTTGVVESRLGINTFLS